MSEIVVVAFKRDLFRAAAVLGELREGDEAWTANLHGAIAAYRNAQGELTVDEAYEGTKGQGAIIGGLMGSLVGLLLAAVALPLTAGASAAVVVGSFVASATGGSILGARHHAVNSNWWKDDIGIPEELIQRIRETVLAGDSAIVFLLRKPDPEDLAARFGPFGGTVLRATLTPEQTAKVHEKLSAG